MLMPLNIFERQQFTHAGGSVGFDPWTWDEELSRYVYGLKKGDSLSIYLHDAASENYITHSTFSVISDDGLCWSNGSLEFCGYADGMYIAFFQRCIPEDQRIKVTGYFNNLPVGHDTFTTTPFHPMVSEITMPAIMEPRRTKYGQGQHGEVTARVRDDIGCNEVISDAKVHIASTIAESHTNGQIYFTKGDVGTGRFSILDGSAQLNPGGEHERDTVIEGDTDLAGLFRTRYQAQHHGAEELLTFTARRPATETRGEIVGDKVLENRLYIAIQGLVRITEENAPLGFNNGVGCPHDPEPRWLTPTTRARVMTLAAIYNYRTGRKLSLNDASLSFGGVIANRKSEGRDEACHDSHRYGIDIDINRVDADSVNMTVTTVEQEGKTLTLLEYMDERVMKVGGSIHHTYGGTTEVVDGRKIRIPSSIHWRLPN